MAIEQEERDLHDWAGDVFRVVKSEGIDAVVTVPDAALIGLLEVAFIIAFEDRPLVKPSSDRDINDPLISIEMMTSEPAVSMAQIGYDALAGRIRSASYRHRPNPNGISGSTNRASPPISACDHMVGASIF